MSKSEPKTPQPITLAGIEIPVADQTPLVLALVAVIKKLERENRKLRDEVDRLKGTTRRPKITPSRLLEKPAGKQDPKGKRPAIGQTSEDQESFRGRCDRPAAGKFASRGQVGRLPRFLRSGLDREVAHYVLPAEL